MVIGKGSNLLVKDGGIAGVVVQLGGEFSEMTVQENGSITAGAGVSLSALCGYALQHGLSGLEFAWGIPGTVGGAVFMNAGAYGEEMKDVVVCCRHMLPGGTIETVSAHKLNFDYRHSIYQENGAVVLEATFALQKSDKAKIKAKMDDLMHRRKTKQPLEFPSAGSVFKRPAGYFAGTLIEECGLKGRTVGGAAVSQKHAGFIINTGEASCQDVLDLIALIQSTVKEKTGVALSCEIRAIGRDK